MNWQQNLHEARKKLMQDKKKRREKGFICHLCGKEMSSGSKWYHLNAVHQLVSDSKFQFIAMTEFNSQNTPRWSRRNIHARRAAGYSQPRSL